MPAACREVATLTAAAIAPPALAGAGPLADLWEDPPLGPDGAEHVAAGSRPARRRFNARWLTATGLMGTAAAALMCGAMFAAIDRDARHVLRPLPASRIASRRPSQDQPKGDRLQPHLASTARLELSHQLAVEQLAPSGTHMRPFTHITAKLAAVVTATADLPRPAPRAPSPSEAAPEDEPAPAPLSARAAAKVRTAGLLGAVERTAHASAVADEALAAIGRAGPRPSSAKPAPTLFGPPPPPPPPSGARPVDADLAPAPTAYASAGFASTAPTLPTAAMPPEILQGDSRPAPPQGAPGQPPPGTPSASMFDDDTAALGVPVNVSVLARGHARPAPRRRMLVAKRGDTLEAILGAAGLSGPVANALAEGLWRAAGRPPIAFAGGEEVMLTEPEDEMAPPDRPAQVLMRAGALVVALAVSDAGAYVPVPVEAPAPKPRPGAAAGIDPERLDGVSVRDALYRLADAKVMEEGLVDALVHLAEHDVDLDAPLSPDDNLDLVFALPDADEGDSRPTAFRQEIAFVALSVDGKTRRYYRFTTPDDGAVDYYDEAGRSVTKLLLRKPFANGRQGDGFGWRVHPILGDRRFHNGVDFVGPAGSPIVAAGAGVVEKIDFETGYGKYIRLRHDGGYETTYAHVSGFPANIKLGQRVRQGQVIAYVGSTGYSTGPHLYYELKVNGHYADPTRIKLAGGRVLQGEISAAFARERARMDALAAAPPAPL